MIGVGILGLVLGCRRPEPRPATAPPVPASPPVLTLLYSSDQRGRLVPEAPGSAGGLARRATLVDRIRLEGPPVLQLDAGDLLPGAADKVPGAQTVDAPYRPGRRSRMVLESYKRMGVDVMTPGERDLDLGPAGLKAAFEAAKISAVAANLVDSAGGHPLAADKLIEVAGLSIGVFGILELLPGQLADLQRLGFRTDDPAEAARAAARSLRARGARLVIGLFHVVGGLPRVKDILTAAGTPDTAAAGGAGGGGGALTGAEIDVVVLGHVSGADVAHAAGPAAGGNGSLPVTMLGRTRVVWNAAPGLELGRLDAYALRGGVPSLLDDHAMALTPSLPDHRGVALIEQVERSQLEAEAESVAAALRRKSGQKEVTVYESWTYGSNEGCAMCHQEQAAQWQTTDHAGALDTLKKNKHNAEPVCLGCHMTGYLLPGGTRRLTTAYTYFSNVGCEACHGPSAEHMRAQNKKTGTRRAVGAEICLGCHTSDQNIGTFEFAAALKSVLGKGHGEALAAKLPRP